MEFVGQQRPSGACGLLGLPGLNTSDLDVDDDEGEEVIGIRPKSSPLPRRKSSTSDEDLEPGPPLSGSRRVSFADAKGLSLVQVKEFDTWQVPKLPGYDSSESEGQDAQDYLLSPLTFSLPIPTEELLGKVREQKVELENIELLAGTTILRGVIRVLNISFHKAVHVRTTLDSWSTHFDLLAEYIPGSSDSLTDCFSFKLILVPPFKEEGARVDFCLRYETPVGTFWSNNRNRNYALFCQHRVKRRQPETEHVNRKSCLKTVSQNFSTVEIISAAEGPNQENVPADAPRHEEEVDTKQNKPVSDGPGTSETDRQKIVAESRRNCSRRNRRKNARMARARDFFARRDGERDESPPEPPEAKQAPQEESPKEKLSKSKSAGSVVEALDVLHDASPAHDSTSNSEPENSGGATLTKGESSTYTEHHPNGGSVPAERQSIDDSEAEEGDQKQSDAEPEPADISATSSESLPSSSFTFGTVVAPLYHQAYGGGERENPSIGDPKRNPLQATQNSVDLNHTDQEDLLDLLEEGDIQENEVMTQESQQESLRTTQNPTEEEEEEEETGLTVKVLDHEETQNMMKPSSYTEQRGTDASQVPEALPGDRLVQANTVNVLDTDLLHSQKPSERLHLQGEEHEDLQGQTAARVQVQLGEHQTCAEGQPEEVTTCLETSFTQPPGSTDCKFEPLISSQTHEDTEAEEVNEAAVIGNHHAHEEDVFNDAEYQKMDSEREDRADVANWEMMVEEEERNIFMDGEEREATSSEEATTKDQEEEDTGVVESEHLDPTETGGDKMVGDITAMMEEESMTEDPDGLEDKPEIGEGPTAETMDGRDPIKMEKTSGEEAGEPDKETENHFAEIQEDNIHEEDKETEEEEEETEEGEEETEEEEEAMTAVLNNVDNVGVENKDQGKPREEHVGQDNPDHKEGILVDETPAVVDDSENATMKERVNGLWTYEENLDFVQDMRVTGDGPNIPCGTRPHEDDRDARDGKAEGTEEGGSHLLAEEPDSDQSSLGGASTESDSDDEVELYMHCLRAVHTRNDGSKDKTTGFSVSRNKMLTTPMPSISESLDEDQSLGHLQDSHEDTSGDQTVAAAPPASIGQERLDTNVPRWIETCSCSNVSKTLLNATLFVLFVVVAYHSDFLACFGLYLIAIIWLCCQGERPAVKNDNRFG